MRKLRFRGRERFDYFWVRSTCSRSLSVPLLITLKKRYLSKSYFKNYSAVDLTFTSHIKFRLKLQLKGFM